MGWGVRQGQPLLLHQQQPAAESTPLLSLQGRAATASLVSPTRGAFSLQAEAAGLERELELARRQIELERRKQEEMSKERER